MMTPRTGQTPPRRGSRKTLARDVALSVFALALLVAFVSRTDAGARPVYAPTEAQIKSALKEILVSPDFYAPSNYRTATLLEFDLERLERTGYRRWIATADILFDFGPPPPGVVGFERRRAGRYRIVMNNNGGGLTITRFNATGDVRPLPAADAARQQ